MPRKCHQVRRVRKRLSITAAYSVADDRGRHVPALPPGLRGPVAEVDVLAVHAEARVEAAELLEHRPAHEQERGEHPVGLHGLLGSLVEEVVRPLPLERREDEAQRRAAHDRAADGREPAARGLPRRRPPRAAAGRRCRTRPRLAMNARSIVDRVRLGDRVRVRQEHERRPTSRPRPGWRWPRSCASASFSSTRVPSGTRPTLPGTSLTTTSSSTCGASAGSDASRSAADPCETTTAETFTARVPRRRRRACAGQSRPTRIAVRARARRRRADHGRRRRARIASASSPRSA